MFASGSLVFCCRLTDKLVRFFHFSAQSLQFGSTARTLQVTYVNFFKRVSSTVEAHACSTSLAVVVCALNNCLTDHTALADAFLRQLSFLFTFLFQILARNYSCNIRERILLASLFRSSQPLVFSIVGSKGFRVTGAFTLQVLSDALSVVTRQPGMLKQDFSDVFFSHSHKDHFFLCKTKLTYKLY